MLRTKNANAESKLAPNSIMFKRHLEGKERIPEHHMHCFLTFTDFLGENMGDSTEELEEVVERPDSATFGIYTTARKLWFEKCLQQADASMKDGTEVGPVRDGYFVGSRGDSAFEVGMMPLPGPEA